MSLNYVNVNDRYCYNEFINNAPSTLNIVIENSNAEPEPEYFNSDELMFITNTNTNAPSTTIITEIKTKRIYQKLTQDQLNVLKRLYKSVGPNFPLSKYSEITGIKIKRIRSLITSLKKGESIDKSTVKKGAQRKLNEIQSSILVDMIKRKNTLTLKEMKNNLQEQNINVSISTIHRHINSYLVDYGLPNITLKRCVTRSSPTTDIEKLKDERIVVIQKLHHYISKGFRPLFVDETHWRLGLVSKRARSEKGSPSVVHQSSSSSDLTVIASCSEIGMHHCQCIYGSNDFDVFRTYIKTLINDIKDLGKFVIFLDNVNLHHNKETEDIIINSGNKILFNATYSSPMNPIENIFSIWKQRAEYLDYINREELLIRIGNSFKTLTSQECYSTIQHVFHSIHRDVINRIDI